MRWNALPLAALCCVSWLWTPQAEAAQDLVPLNGPGHIRVAPPNEDPAIFYPVDPGAELQYAFTGPGKVVIWVRSTRPPDQPWIYGPYLQMPVKADGWSLLELVLRPKLTPMGTVDGEGTPFPPLANAMQVDVDGPCSSLGLMAPGTCIVFEQRKISERRLCAGWQVFGQFEGFCVNTKNKPVLTPR